eukprot:sb/3478116/
MTSCGVTSCVISYLNKRVNHILQDARMSRDSPPIICDILENGGNQLFMHLFQHFIPPDVHSQLKGEGVGVFGTVEAGMNSQLRDLGTCTWRHIGISAAIKYLE